jgi:hypothetical protein
VRPGAACWVTLSSSRTIGLAETWWTKTDLFLAIRTDHPAIARPWSQSYRGTRSVVVLKYRWLTNGTLVLQRKGSARVAARQDPGPV